MTKRAPQPIRARCARVLTRLGIDRHTPTPVGVKDIQLRVQQLRGRPLRLVGVVLPPGCPSGMWMDTDQADVVIFDVGTSPLHQLHILCHEVAHMLLGHAGDGELLDQNVTAMFRALLPTPPATVMMRSCYGRVEEHEAEVFATMACQRLGDVELVHGEAGVDAEVVRRLLAALAGQATPGTGE